MPLGGIDTRYDLPWTEQDKIRRRLEIKQRLKQEGIRSRYNPFLHMQQKICVDPALDRYLDVRKRGRLPNTPMRPTLFYGMSICIFLPIYLLAKGAEWERKDYLQGCSDGSIPYRDRKNRFQG